MKRPWRRVTTLQKSSTSCLQLCSTQVSIIATPSYLTSSIPLLYSALLHSTPLLNFPLISTPLSSPLLPSLLDTVRCFVLYCDVMSCTKQIWKGLENELFYFSAPLTLTRILQVLLPIFLFRSNLVHTENYHNHIPINLVQTANYHNYNAVSRHPSAR